MSIFAAIEHPPASRNLSQNHIPCKFTFMVDHPLRSAATHVGRRGRPPTPMAGISIPCVSSHLDAAVPCQGVDRHAKTPTALAIVAEAVGLGVVAASLPLVAVCDSAKDPGSAWPPG